MNRLIILFLILTTFNSCFKIQNVHFHGHIINGCTGLPAANVQFEIWRDYDIGHEEAEEIGAVTTDDNGYYELIADVSKKGGFNYYYILVIGKPYGVEITHTENATADSKDVVMDGIESTSQPFKFHIKNTSPFDGNDNFNYLKYFINLHEVWMPIIVDSTFSLDPQYHNLKGRFVDFIYNDSLPNDQSEYYFRFSFTKNGITTERFDTVQMSCFDTTDVEIFY
jgi:5-hydroxyisourate hydrolase-like protein (transthyretin family)